MRPLVFLAIVTSVICQRLYSSYNTSSIELSRAGFCPSTEKLREKKLKHEIDSFINFTVFLALRGREACDCGGPGWRRAVYFNMSDPTQTCPPVWELITTPRRSCAPPSSAGNNSYYSAMFLLDVFSFLSSAEESIGTSSDNHKLKFSIILNGLVDNYLSQLSLIWKSGCA